MPPRTRRSTAAGTTGIGVTGHTLPGNLVTESRSVASLAADPANLRRHDDGNVRAIMGSLKRFGQQKPIVIDRADVVRAGSGTLEAARRLEWESIDVVVSALTDAELVAYGIADNRTGETSTWDLEGLAATLPMLDPDLLDATGFDADDLAHMLKDLNGPVEGAGDKDALPATPSRPISKSGDVWVLGPHRLVVGDCRDLDAVHTLMQGARADCMWTDPPYAVDVVGGDTTASKTTRRAAGGKTIDNDGGADVEQLLLDAFRAATEALRPGAPFYIAHPDGPRGAAFYQAVQAARWHWSQTLIWDKGKLVPGQSDYHVRHEPILYGYLPIAPGNGRRGRRSKNWFGDNAQSSVFEVPRPTRSEDHPTMKPVDLIVAHLGNSAGPRGVIYDPFAGSGSTMIAAHTLGQSARLFEVNTGYADVICRRFQDFAEVLPVNERTGKAVDFTRRTR